MKKIISYLLGLLLSISLVTASVPAKKWYFRGFEITTTTPPIEIPFLALILIGIAVYLYYK